MIHFNPYRTVEQVLEGLTLPFEPKPRQLEVVRELSQFPRVGLFAEVGTGKTLMSTLLALMRQPPRVLVCMPPILLDQWAEWLDTIGVKGVLVFRGPKRKAEDLKTHQWILCSHAIFRDSFADIKAVFKTGKDVLIVDEAHALKSTESKLWRMVRSMVLPDGDVILVTGTPTSKPADAFAYVKLKTPPVYRSWSHFEACHVQDKDYFGSVTKWKDLDTLAENLALQSVRLTREEIFGPQAPANIYALNYRLSDEHAKLYKKLAEEQLLLLEGDGKIDATTPTRLYHALQQIVVNLDHFSGNPAKRSAAYDVIDQYIEESECLDPDKGKAIIWTYYQRTSDSVVAYLRKKHGDRTVAAAYGKVDSAKGVHAAMHDPQCRIFVAVPRSCGAGLNLQHVAHTALFLETPIVPIEATQAIGRIDRAGQTKVCDIRIATAFGTIQQKLFRQLLRKDDLVGKVEGNVKTLRSAIFGGD